LKPLSFVVVGDFIVKREIREKRREEKRREEELEVCLCEDQVLGSSISF